LVFDILNHFFKKEYLKDLSEVTIGKGMSEDSQMISKAMTMSLLSQFEVKLSQLAMDVWPSMMKVKVEVNFIFILLTLKRWKMFEDLQ